jgi:hypothetical protein
VFSVVIILILIYNVSPNLFKFDFISFISQTPANLGDIFQPKDLSQAKQYEGYESSYDGMILEKDAGYGNIDEVLRSKVTIPDCSICPSSDCQLVTLGGINTYRCNECGTCNGISQPGRFENCLGCDITKETCVLCIDASEEYALCNRIKSCILDLYSTDNKNGCFIGEISHNDGTSFDINTLINVLSSCKSESIEINMGNNFMKELCYFDSSSVSYYDFNRPNDFYLDKKHSSGPYPGGIVPSPFGYDIILWNSNDYFTPFYNLEGQATEKYRVYVALKSDANTNFEVYVGNYRNPDALNPFDKGINYECKLGEITSVSNEFEHREFIDFSNCPSEWKDNPEKYPLNGIRIPRGSGVGIDKVDVRRLVRMPRRKSSPVGTTSA